MTLKNVKTKAALLLIVIGGFLSFAENNEDQKMADMKNRLSQESGISRIDLLNELAYKLEYKDTSQCIAYAREALKLSRNLNHQKGEAMALRNLGVGHIVQGNWGKALNHLKHSLKIYEKLGDKKGMTNLYLNIGRVFSKTGKNNLANEYYQKCHNIAQETGNKKGMSSSLHNMGIVFFNLGNYTRALEHFQRSLQLEKELGKKGNTSLSINCIGAVYSVTGKYDEALKYYMESLKLNEQSNNKRGIAFSTGNIGLIYKNLKNVPQALKFLERSLKLEQEIGNKSGIAATLNNIGNVYLGTLDYEKALDYHLKSLQMKQVMGDKQGIASSMGNIGEIYLGLKNHKKAREFFKKSLKLEIEIGDKRGITGSYLRLGKLAMTLNQSEAALTHLLKGMKIAQEIQTKVLIKDFNQQLSQLYASRGDYKLALDYYKQYNQVKDEIINKEANDKIIEMQTQYEAEKKEKEIALLAKDNVILKNNSELLAKDNKIKILTRNALIAILILILTVVSLLFKKYLYLLAFWQKKTYIGHFKLQNELGRGGMSIVYKAKDLANQSKSVAVKIIKDEFSQDHLLKQRFKNEGAVIDQFNHPNIIKVYERGEFNNRLYIAMEYLEGYSLAEIIKKDKPIPIKDCYAIMIQLAKTLTIVHGKGILHRDLKPDNIMILAGGNGNRQVKLLDFGLAKTQLMSTLTESGDIFGTLYYLPPERIRFEPQTTASDIYSLGVVFYEMCTFKKPFMGESPEETLIQIKDFVPVEPSIYRKEITADINSLILNMIDKVPARRPSNDSLIHTIEKHQ